MVRDASSGDTLAAAIVRVLGTSYGTITNERGTYSLKVDLGNHVLRFSSLGYRPDTVGVTLDADREIHISLERSPIVLPEVVVSSEDPAVAIIRKAIANKRRWRDRLSSYTLNAFTRQTLDRDTSIASITESYTRGYWQRGDTLREVVVQRRQTENIPEGQNFASVGRILDFSEERIRFAGYSFAGPIADDAFDYYDYKLVATRGSGTEEVHEIRVLPRSRTDPLLGGTVVIAGRSYALIGVDVSPNEAFLLPFVKKGYLRYRQEFSLYDRIFWMPVDIRIEGTFEVGILGFSIPKIAFHQTSVVYSYEINTPLPDSLFRRPRLSVDSVSVRSDTTLWEEVNILPLSPRQETAYRELDSTQTLDVQFRPGGLTATLGSGGATGLILRFADVAYNRVEGFRLGIRGDFDSVLNVVDVRTGFAYGFSDQLTKYVVGATVFASDTRVFGIGGDLYRRMDHRPDLRYYGSALNSLSSILVKNDYWDYYRSEGWGVFVTGKPSTAVVTRVSFVSEDHRSMRNTADFGVFFPSRDFRMNPPVEEGRFNALRVWARIGNDPVPLDLIWRDALEVSVEYSEPSLTGGDFDFVRYYAVGSIAVPTFGRSFLLKPVLRLRVAAGSSSGDLPSQRLYDLESSLSGIGPFGVLRGSRVKEFSGTSFLSASLEHNFRSIPFLALGVPFLYENNLELILEATAARTWNNGSYSLTTTDGWYYEIGLGISRIFEILRADFTWRMADPKGVRFTIATATIL
ncbi:MAG: carboxypeptidase-like regulatory domain-containing protein [Bacteroidetes bacterium]|nr:carboxypeptidase-like regulatory domain-containing protein [Bacteroidota bacterium]